MLHAYTCPDQNSLLTLLTSAENPSLLYSTYSYFSYSSQNVSVVLFFYLYSFSRLHSHILFTSNSFLLVLLPLSIPFYSHYHKVINFTLSFVPFPTISHSQLSSAPYSYTNSMSALHSFPAIFLSFLLLSAQRTVASTVTQRAIICSKHYIIFFFFFRFGLNIIIRVSNYKMHLLLWDIHQIIELMMKMSEFLSVKRKTLREKERETVYMQTV